MQVLFFNWDVYSFGGRHFISTIWLCNLPIHITLACNQVESGRALFHEFTSCPKVFGNGKELLNYIRASGDSSQVHGYLIHLLWFKVNEARSTFWQLQSTIIAQLWSLHDLQLVVAIILPDHDGRCVESFILSLKWSGWVVSTSELSFSDTGDSIAGGCWILTGVHTSCASTVEPLHLNLLPYTHPQPLGASVWEPINKPEHVVSLVKDNEDFCRQDIRYSATKPPTPSPLPSEVLFHTAFTPTEWQRVLFFRLCGYLSPGSLSSPPFNACPNRNMFQHFSTLNPTMKIIHMSGAYLSFNLPAALDSLTIWLIVFPRQSISSVWTWLFPPDPSPGFLTRYLTVWLSFVIQTAKF